MPRHHTFFLKNLPASHSLKALYKHPNNVDNVNNYIEWRNNRRSMTLDNYPTNTHIHFTSLKIEMHPQNNM